MRAPRGLDIITFSGLRSLCMMPTVNHSDPSNTTRQRQATGLTLLSPASLVVWWVFHFVQPSTCHLPKTNCQLPRLFRGKLGANVRPKEPAVILLGIHVMDQNSITRIWIGFIHVSIYQEGILFWYRDPTSRLISFNLEKSREPQTLSLGYWQFARARPP